MQAPTLSIPSSPFSAEERLSLGRWGWLGLAFAEAACASECKLLPRPLVAFVACCWVPAWPLPGGKCSEGCNVTELWIREGLRMRCQLGHLCFGEQASEYCLCIPYYLASNLIPVERLQIFSQLPFNFRPSFVSMTVSESRPQLLLVAHAKKRSKLQPKTGAATRLVFGPQNDSEGISHGWARLAADGHLQFGDRETAERAAHSSGHCTVRGSPLTDRKCIGHANCLESRIVSRCSHYVGQRRGCIKASTPGSLAHGGAESASVCTTKADTNIQQS